MAETKALVEDKEAAGRFKKRYVSFSGYGNHLKYVSQPNNEFAKSGVYAHAWL